MDRQIKDNNIYNVQTDKRQNYITGRQIQNDYKMCRQIQNEYKMDRQIQDKNI